MKNKKSLPTMLATVFNCNVDLKNNKTRKFVSNRSW